MTSIICPCCAGKGEIEGDAYELLTPMQKRIYAAIRDNAGKLGGERLINMLYGDRFDGGPDYPWDSIHVTIHNMNKLLAPLGQRIRASRRGPGATYMIAAI